jgi:hypothetical protein
MALFYNSSEIIGASIDAATINITGTQFLTLLAIIIVLMLLLAVLRIPLEYGILIIMPVFIIMAAFEASFLTFFGLTLVYMGILFAKYYFTSR